MNDFLLYILKSTFSISLLYLAFRLLMRRDASFSLNRVIILLMVIGSTIIPLLYLPQQLQTNIQVEFIPEFSENKIQINNLPVSEITEPVSTAEVIERSGNELTISLQQLLLVGYLTGILISLLILIQSIVSVLMLFRKAKVKHMDGYRLFIIDREVPSFAFGRSVVISQSDYESHRTAILAHEHAHIRLNHFYDLILLEMVKIFHWFNPAMYGIISDMKEIHEFQADDQTLQSGIDVTKYQLLIIQKSVGPKRFALANSFNHCQIKKRITMMNKQKTGKAGFWKVATFLPLLALLLMAFGKSGENESEKMFLLEKVVAFPEIVQSQNELTSRLIEIKSDGNYIDKKPCSMEEIVKIGQDWGKASNDWIHIRIDESIPFNRIDEIRRTLRDANVYHITLSTANSDETVYFAGDVSKAAEFSQGSLSDWIIPQIIQLTGGKSKELNYSVITSFITDKNGKVLDARLSKKSDFPEINEAFEKVLAQIPDWIPAMRGNENVSVYHDIMFGNKSKNVKKDVSESK